MNSVNCRKSGEVEGRTVKVKHRQIREDEKTQTEAEKDQTIDSSELELEPRAETLGDRMWS